MASSSSSSSSSSLATLLTATCCILRLALIGTSLQPMDIDGGAVGMQSEELLALAEVMAALLEDPSWVQLHPSPCTDTPWPGIQCEMVLKSQTLQDPYLHVTKIHIGPDVASPPCKASASLSHSLLKLPYLKSLSLFSCFLIPGSASLPPSLFINASSLEQLVIKSNPGLCGIIPVTLGSLQSLRVLSLSQNSLHGGIPKELGALTRLEQLDLSYNNLTGTIPAEIGGLASLTILDLSWNELEGEIPGSLGQLQFLQKMDLSFNKMSGRIPEEAGKLEKLVLLDLSHNSLTGPIPDTLSGMQQVQYLLVENNSIGTSIPSFVGSLKKLLVLGFSGCGLLGPIPAFLGDLNNLTTLTLDRNSLNGTVPTSLERIPNLGQLNLSQNKLSGALNFSEEFVSRLGRRLDVRDNQGLCIKAATHQINFSYFYLEAPACDMDNTKSSSSRSSWAPDEITSSGEGERSNALKVRQLLVPLWCLVLVTVRSVMEF